MDPISLSLLGPILEAASHLIDRLFDVTTARKRASVGFLLETLDTLERLIGLHTQAVATVTAPIVKQGNIRQSYEAFYDLVNNSAFPGGYSSIRATLQDFRKRGVFRKANPLTRLDAVRDNLYRFQVSAFMLTEDMDEANWPSFQVAKAFQKAVTLWDRLSRTDPDQPDPNEVNALRQGLCSGLAHYAWAEQENSLQIPADVVRYMAVWCKGWQETVQGVLYGAPKAGGHNLARSIGELKTLLHR